ncbi:putative cytochrome P450 [Apodospora peruviana]|uniref:Cytochrome P450 n=1 Tax=Apodospora peruviana TaxID=516989 RepID=A0AAE0M2H4_9PEZI|nr:putative cytochrome P450 [Apodospora peruviana]
MILSLILGPVLAYMIWSLICLEKNVRVARRVIGVPVIRSPIDGNNIPYQVFSPFFWMLLDLLPIKWSSYPDFIRFWRGGWHVREKADPHVRLGPVWALVTPACIELQFADPDAIMEIYARRRDFVRPIKQYRLLEVYGPCISTAGWDDWPRHRKVLAAPFSENIMKFVWDESLRQARSLRRSWFVNAAEAGVPSVQKDVRALSLNVLASTGFRKSYDFHGSADAKPKSDENVEVTGYRETLQTVLDNCIPLMLIPYRVLTGPFMPKGLAKVGRAGAKFRDYMVQMLEEEKAALKEGRPGVGGIMTAFVHSLIVHEKEMAQGMDPKAISVDGKKGLSQEEIFSNMFVINFAGHDTTANTLAFCMLQMAANPKVQEWLGGEINRVISADENEEEEWDYKTVFPKLKRCTAVLYETLRLYPAVVALPKWTEKKAQTLKVGGRTLTVPAGVYTMAACMAIQQHPQFWGDDAETWRPERWIVRNEMGEEELYVPREGTFFPWSDGPQNCPGKKFAEVEAVAFLACLFRKHRVEAKKTHEGESEEAVRNRVLACVNDVNMDMLVRMNDPDRVRVVCKEVTV